MGNCGSKRETPSPSSGSDNNMIVIGGGGTEKAEAYAQLDNENELFFKLLLLGDSGVGKSTILSMFSDQKFNPSHISTVGVDFKTVHLNISGKTVQLQVWDTAGQERYRSIITAYYRGAHGILLTFDLTRRESYDSIRRWLQDVHKHAHQHTKTVLVGNKKDVEHMRNVTREEAEELATELGVRYFEVSAKGNDGIKEVFEDIAQQLIDSM